MRSLGNRPSFEAWAATENAPVMTACEAMMVAAVASSTMGSRAQCGISRKNGALTELWSPRMSAPCPK